MTYEIYQNRIDQDNQDETYEGESSDALPTWPDEFQQYTGYGPADEEWFDENASNGEQQTDRKEP